MHEYEEPIGWEAHDEYQDEEGEEKQLSMMTFKNIDKPTAGAIVGRTPFLLFVGTWDTELTDSNKTHQSKERVIEKMKRILIGSLINENEKCYNGEISKSRRTVGEGEIRLDKPMKINSDGLYSMLFASTFHPEYIVAC